MLTLKSLQFTSFYVIPGPPGRICGARWPLCRHTKLARTSLRRWSPRDGHVSAAAGPNGAKPAHKAQDTIKNARLQQLAATDMLATLLQAPDIRSAVQSHMSSLTEDFFSTCSLYLEMARKEGNADVKVKLEAVLKVAMEEKQKTLRPEIQLLNSLLSADSTAGRRSILNTPESVEQLQMNDKYFFGLVERMMSDVKRQPESARKVQLATRLKDIKKEALARLP